MNHPHLRRLLSFALLGLCLVSSPVQAEEMKIIAVQTFEGRATSAPLAKTLVSIVSLEDLPEDASQQLLKNSWVNGFLFEEYARAVKANDTEKLREIYSARPTDIPIPTGGSTTQVQFIFADGTKVELSNLYNWSLKGYIGNQFWSQFRAIATPFELPGNVQDFPLPPPKP